MKVFMQDISERLSALKQNNFEEIKEQLSKKFKYQLPYDFKYENEQLQEWHIAFLDLYKDKAVDLFSSYDAPLQQSLRDFYQYAEEVDAKMLSIANCLSIISIGFPENESSSEWEIDYETSFDETIYHVYFDGWVFKYIGITH